MIKAILGFTLRVAGYFTLGLLTGDYEALWITVCGAIAIDIGVSFEMDKGR